MVFTQEIMGKAVRPCAMHKDLSFVQYRPQKSLDMTIERFFESLRFEQRGELDQLGIEIGSFD
jgi:hypothetical protein